MHRQKTAKLTLEIARKIKELITSGSFQAGDCIPSERSLLIEFEVSRETIRRSLNELIKEGILSKEKSRGYYIPKKSVLPIVTQKENAVIFLPTKTFIDDNEHLIWQGAREYCLKNNLKMIEEDFINVTSLELASKLKKIKKMGIGILSDITKQEILMKIYNAGIPLVHIYHPMEDLPFDTIVQDDLLGIKLAYEHLISKGHRKICLLDKSLSIIKIGGVAYNQLRRRIGYQFAAEQTNTFDPKLIINIDHDYSFLETENDCFSRITQSGATALIFPNTINYEILKDGLHRSATKFSTHKNTAKAIKTNKFGIITWGDHLFHTSNNAKTHINWSKQQMGQEGVRRLIEKIKEPHLPSITITIPTYLVKGNSSGKGPYFNKSLISQQDAKN